MMQGAHGVCALRALVNDYIEPLMIRVKIYSIEYSVNAKQLGLSEIFVQ